MAAIFGRFERKFLVTKDQKDQIIKELEHFLCKDYYSNDGGYTIFNWYLDDDNFTLLKKSISKPYYKEKLRIRSYSEDLDAKVFIEIKKKVGGFVSKRRLSGSREEILDFVYNGTMPSNLSYLERQIANELKYKITSYNVKPKGYIRYQREAFYYEEDENFRLTFDRQTSFCFEEKVEGHLNFLLPEDVFIMEVKFLNAMPLWFIKALNNNNVYAQSFSKIGKAYEQMRMEDLNRVY